MFHTHANLPFSKTRIHAQTGCRAAKPARPRGPRVGEFSRLRGSALASQFPLTQCSARETHDDPGYHCNWLKAGSLTQARSLRRPDAGEGGIQTLSLPLRSGLLRSTARLTIPITSATTFPPPSLRSVHLIAIRRNADRTTSRILIDFTRIVSLRFWPCMRSVGSRG